MECVRTFVKTERFSRDRILLCALAARITLVLYAHIHDYVFNVNFTDIDYSVFSDAAEHVRNGRSPFDRLTYRYTPALAWMLLPVGRFPDFGKVLFCIFDIIVALFYFKILEKDLLGKSEEERIKIENDQTTHVVLFWLANPLTAIISARGNAEAVVAAIVLLNLILLQKGYWKTSALVHGSLAIQFKIYPVLFLPSVFLHLSTWNDEKGFTNKIKSLFVNWKGFLYVFIALASFAGVVAFFYQFYGELFLEEFLLYHIKRVDIKHNFSPYFYILYLIEEYKTASKIVGILAFVPQIVLTVVYAFKYHNDLPFCWFLTTFAFVAFNKVCTSQYFVWYLVFLPLVANRIEIPKRTAIFLTALWFGSQGVWLFFAYLFEFKGMQTLPHTFLASCLFLIVNCIIIRYIRKYYVSPENQLKSKSD